MNTLELKQIPLTKQIINHFYVGVIITLFYIWFGPKVIDAGYPGMTLLLLAELLILTPIVFIHLYWSNRNLEGPQKLRVLLPYQSKLSIKSFILWTLGGLLVSVLIYAPLYPVGIYFRETVFQWLPEWYFNPSYGVDNIQLIANTFLMAIIIDGIIGPVAEELFFRGYLLPRMAYLKNWAPVISGCLFGIYHFWQPHNLIALMALGVVISFVVWKTKNVFLGISIHCTLNIVGSLGGYLAALDGTIIGR